jgi:metal transporter CNNM
MSEVFRLNYTDVLDEKLIKRIAKYGFSRIPIFEGDSCVGIMWAKSLLDINLSAQKTIRSAGVRLVTPLIIASQTNLLEALSIMEQKKASIAMIHESDGGFMRHSRPMSTTFRTSKIISGNFKTKIIGLITLKNIFERLVERDFEDHDQHLRSMVSQTYFGSKGETPPDQGPRLIEMEEPAEYQKKKEPLL